MNETRPVSEYLAISESRVAAVAATMTLPW